MQLSDFQTLWWIKDGNKWSLCVAASEVVFFFFFFLVIALNVNYTFSVYFKLRSFNYALNTLKMEVKMYKHTVYAKVFISNLWTT